MVRLDTINDFCQPEEFVDVGTKQSIRLSVMIFYSGFPFAFAIFFLWAVRAFYIRRKLPKGAKWLPGPPGTRSRVARPRI